MKKLTRFKAIKWILPLCFASFLNINNGYAQNCGQLKKGGKIVLEVKTYPLIHDKVGTDFYTLKPAKKVAKAEEYSAELNAGKVNPSATYTMEYVVTDVNANGEYELSADFYGTTYKSYVNCRNDSMYIIRAKGLVYSVYQKDTLGFGTKGTQIIPYNLKTGDLTPGYVDESILTYKNSDIKKTAFALSDGSYNAVSGTVTTITYSGYVPAKIDYSVKGKTLYIYQPGVVVAEEDITVGGKKYKTYKLRTEIWMKNDTKGETKVELDNWFADPKFNKQIHSQLQTSADKANTNVKARMDEMLGTNKAGYIVTYKEEWIAPGLGVVLTKAYDQWGCLISETTLKAIE